MNTYNKANVNAPVDWEQLMIEALDGTLAESDRQALETYFDLHPQERALFERMRGLDDTLHLAPLIAAPASLAPQVMRQTAQTHVAQPPLCASQIAFLILSAVFWWFAPVLLCWRWVACCRPSFLCVRSRHSWPLCVVWLNSASACWTS